MGAARRLVVLEGYPHAPGGSQLATEVLAVGLGEHGWHTEVVAPADGPVLDTYRRAGIDVTVLPAPGPLLRYGGTFSARDKLAAATLLGPWTARLARHLRRGQAAALDVTDQRGVVLGGLAAKVARVPLVWHVHATGSSSRLDRIGRSLASRCIVTSTGAAAQLGGTGHACIPPGLPVTPPLTEAPRSGGPVRIVAAGRLQPVKGFDVLIAAAARLVEAGRAVTVDIYGAEQAGHEQHARDLRGAIDVRGLGGVVRLMGFRPQPWQDWDGAHLFVLPSREEAFGLALLEAMACGLPVVATRTHGPLDIVVEGRTGLLVGVDDPAALAAAIESVLADPAAARAMGRAGRQRVLEQYSVERYVAEHAHLLDALVDRGRR